MRYAIYLTLDITDVTPLKEVNEFVRQFGFTEQLMLRTDPFQVMTMESDRELTEQEISEIISIIERESAEKLPKYPMKFSIERDIPLDVSR